MKSLNKTLMICSIGTILEWYDFSLFGSLAPVLSRLFFAPQGNDLLFTFGVFATGFLMRPFGAVFFGHKSDKRGRKAALSGTVILMALSTSLIGLSPTYAQVGLFAGVFITLMRLLQGFSASGEYPSAIALLTEMAPASSRGFYGSFSMLGVSGGLVLGSLSATLVSTLLTESQLYAWGWRIPFLMSIPLGVIGFYLRYRMEESPAFQELLATKTTRSYPVSDALKETPGEIFQIFWLFSLGTVSYYVVFVYFTTYLAHLHPMELSSLLIIKTVCMAVMGLLIPFFGYLSDRYQRKPIMAIGAASIILFSYPLFLLMNSGTYLAVFVAQFIFAVLIAFFSGPVTACATEQFPTAIRSSAISLALNLQSTLLGGTAPLIATYLVSLTGSPLSPCFYLIICAFFVLMALSKIRGFLFDIPQGLIKEI